MNPIDELQTFGEQAFRERLHLLRVGEASGELLAAVQHRQWPHITAAFLRLAAVHGELLSEFPRVFDDASLT